MDCTNFLLPKNTPCDPGPSREPEMPETRNEVSFHFETMPFYSTKTGLKTPYVFRVECSTVVEDSMVMNYRTAYRCDSSDKDLAIQSLMRKINNYHFWDIDMIIDASSNHLQIDSDNFRLIFVVDNAIPEQLVAAAMAAKPWEMRSQEFSVEHDTEDFS